MFTPLNPPITRWRNQRVWLVGASSGIGAALAERLIALGARVAVSARREAPLVELLAAAGVQATPDRALLLTMDVTDADSVRAAHAAVVAAWGGVDLVIWVAGTYAAMRADTFDLDAAHRVIEANLQGVFNGLAVILPQFIGQGTGALAIVSSVAGYSGLPKALVYGPTKAALINLCESLYLDLHPRGIGVTLINPGFVETPLTAGNDFHMPALISPHQAAGHILEGLERGSFEIHFPRRFTTWLKTLRLLPYRLYFLLVAKTAGPSPQAGRPVAMAEDIHRNAKV